MSYAYLFAGEDLELAEADLEGFLRSHGIKEDPEQLERVALTDAEPSQLRRLGLTHEVVEVLARGELETSYRPEGSYAVRAEDLGAEVSGIEKQLGEQLSTEENEVDLENPEEVIRVYALEDEHIVGRLVEDIDRSLFNQRKNQERPFSSPVSLDPVLARVLVNLSGVKPGEKLLDPFCGTGGILIEAGLCGVDVYGADMQQEMVEGARKNLEEYGVIRHDIREAEFSELGETFEDIDFDAVVTDLPYGRASKKENEAVEEFVEKAGELAETVVFMSNSEDLGEPEFEVYVHKNLTRYIYRL
ncbi:MAG: methyltransferase domain-containing protein [Candidatus Nanohaloarchaea archaeon]